ncbi:MAG: DNA-directed RNA polymerase subunit omega [Clostridia bacterium]|nr:DNA-directed RNA polymerase subunit omega [Clostridia bacterium]
MINEPSVDALVRKLGTEEEPVSRYELCVIVSKRTRQIITQMQATGTQELPGKQKEIVLACQEVMNGKVTSAKD